MTSPLEAIQIATPCSAEWGEMVGDERVRRCGDCDRNVYDLSGFTRAEAGALLAEHTDRLPCLRLWRRRDGTILTADCPVGLAVRLRRRALLGWARATALLGLTALSGCSRPTMGEPIGCGGPPPLIQRVAPRELGPELHDLVPEHELLERPEGTPKRLPRAD